jgi:hypothetical protein
MVMAWFPVELTDAAALTQTVRDTVSLELSQSQVIREVRLPDGPFTGNLGSTAAVLVFPLFALGLAGLSLAAPPASDRARGAGRLEQTAIQWGTILLAASIFTGMIWANFSWGGAAAPDPWLFAGITTLILLIAWNVADATFDSGSTLPSWIALAALMILLWSNLGPSLGWTAPSLHNFGP